MDLNQYLEIFLEESREHLQNINEQLLKLEENPTDLSIINEIFRSAHTLKGMSATMGYEDLANLTHKMENVLDGIRNHVIDCTSSVVDVVFQAVDHLEAMVSDISNGGTGKHDVSETVDLLLKIEKGESFTSISTAPQAEKEVVTNDELDSFQLEVIQQAIEQGFTCLNARVKLRDDCLLKAARVYMVFEVLEQVGEVIKSTPSIEQLEEEKFDSHFTLYYLTKEEKEDIEGRILKVSEVDEVTIELMDLTKATSPSTREVAATSERVSEPVAVETIKPTQSSEVPIKEQSQSTNKASNSSKTIRVNIERLDILMNLFEELVIDRGRLEQISRDLNNGELTETVERMTRISGDLQNIILNMRMVPVETVFNRFPRMIRQLAKDLGKQVNLQIIGAETELDRTVIDEIGDPLVHLLRNALDHGIESPEKRKASGKPEVGQVILKAYHSGNHVFIQIDDDGAGINRERVLQKAIEKGIVSEQNAINLSDRQVNELILASGFSTADVISDISGRGVGLDVVKNTIESLGGSIMIDSEHGFGSKFLIQLPLTLSIISVMLIELEKEKYAIPLSSIIETAVIKKEEILNAHNQKVIDFRGRVVPLVFLKDVFEVESSTNVEDFYSVIIVRKGEKLAGLVVDSFIGQQEIVLKSLGDYLQSVFAISGATILGDGQVALIIDCNALIK